MKRKMKRELVQPGLYKVSWSHKFPKGSWLIRYRDPDNYIRQRSFATKMEALDFQASVRTDKNRGDFLDPRLARTLFRDVAERWYATTADLKPKTRAGYRLILDAHLLPEFEHQAVGGIQPSAIRQFLAGRGRKIGTQRNILRVLSPIMDLAVEDRMIRANPCAQVRLRSNGEGHEEMRKLEAKQVHELAEEVGPEYRTLILFASYTGMRAGEIVALRVKHLDLLHRRVNVKESASDVNGIIHIGKTKTVKSQRQVALPSFLAEILTEHIAGRGQEDHVFPGTRGGTFRHGNFYGRHFRPAVNRLVDRGDWPEELRGLRFHDLRHTCASLLISKGVQPLAVSRQLGHSSIAITMDRYSHLYPEDQDKVAEALDEVAEGMRISAEATVVSLPSAAPPGR